MLVMTDGVLTVGELVRSRVARVALAPAAADLLVLPWGEGRRWGCLRRERGGSRAARRRQRVRGGRLSGSVRRGGPTDGGGRTGSHGAATGDRHRDGLDPRRPIRVPEAVARGLRRGALSGETH